MFGFFKVVDHENKFVVSPGRLTGLNVSSHFYMGHYGKYTPGLLPKRDDFRKSFSCKAQTVSIWQPRVPTFAARLSLQRVRF